ncbi:hypothetical protein PROFUN_12230 [Planoprotostelium fungivorum]|uniref:Uncharacterized protein n=1 Tax=Planoprotostelium fungivorum TaxID=1890364 RepID=A0A2P6N863_9EUKA|nr:hypothetical protein PROFUN_12230 [Planoprotostelium fungivorum]
MLQLTHLWIVTAVRSNSPQSHKSRTSIQDFLYAFYRDTTIFSDFCRYGVNETRVEKKSYDTMASCAVTRHSTDIAHGYLPDEFGMGSWVFNQV